MVKMGIKDNWILISETPKSFKCRFARKRHFSKNRLEMFFFWKPISKLVDSYFFRILGHSLADWHKVKVRAWGRNGHFFNGRSILLEIVPFSQFWTKTYISNTHYLAFFMLYTNQITKIWKKFFWPFQTINKEPMGRVKKT